MDTFDHVLNWKLKAGSHPSPGPDGGTCINEVAVVAADFEYRRVRTPSDMPECFSRPICRLAMRLNDCANDEQRQRLLPYVIRLACADSKGVELAREAYITWHTRHDYIIPFEKGLRLLDGALAIGRQAEALGPEKVRTRMEAARAGKSKPTSALTPASDADMPFFSKAKSWLTIKETDSAA